MVREAPEAARDGELARFGLAEGPVANYERVLRVGASVGGGSGARAPGGRIPGGGGGERIPGGGGGERIPGGGGGEPGTGGAVEVVQEVRFRVGVPYVSWLFALPLLAELGGLTAGASGTRGRAGGGSGTGSRAPWWAPPQRMAHQQATALAGLCGFAVLAGYLDGLLPATMTYIGREYHVGDAGQGYALAMVQAGAVLALGALVAADRRGRRRSILIATVGGSLASVAAAACPSLSTVVVTQLAASALLTAQYVLLGVSAVELMPAGARAWALALLTMSYGLGGGVTLLALPLAELGPGGWRWPYLIAALAVGAAFALVRHVPETGRWEVEAARWLTGPAGRSGRRSAARSGRWSPVQRRRLAVLGAGALLYALFATPAAQFQNQYLRVQRHWSAVHISLAEQAVGTVGALGTLPGGRLADTRGRRPVLAVTLAAGTVCAVLSYLTRGPELYGWMTAASVLSYAVTPSLAVYGAELFPTGLRGRAGGVLNLLGAGGGLSGLAVTGAVAGTLGRLGPALVVVAAGPLLVVALVLLAYPETAARPLEELNPGDRVETGGKAADPGYP